MYSPVFVIPVLIPLPTFPTKSILPTAPLPTDEAGVEIPVVPVGEDYVD